MGWNVDREPIDYLRRRVRYYQNKKKKIIKLKDNPAAQQKFGNELSTLIARRLLTIESMMDMFKKAIRDLETIEEIENKVDNQEPFKS